MEYQSNEEIGQYELPKTLDVREVTLLIALLAFRQNLDY
jgi:hypothetical protein